MTVLTEAFVLRKSQRGDFDRHYVLLTKDLGKVSVLAKGAMKISSKLAPHLDFFYLTEVVVAPGRNFYHLAGAKLKRAYLKNDLDPLKLRAACFFLETADILLRENSRDAASFAVMSEFFSALAAAANSREVQLVLNQSLFYFLSGLGYQPRIKSQNQKQLTHELHQLILEVGEKDLKSFSALKGELEAAAVDQ
ncbi:MAG: recombination protein O N-terminal domain-containing protein [Patescibacteria group bacterium]